MKLKKEIKEFLQHGTVIPAHPLALTADLQLDEARQRNLTRYYLNCKVGGIAVGVHTTQFEIRDPNINLYGRVLELAADEVKKANLERPFIKVAGICGPTSQALEEACIAVDYGYDLGLVSLGGLNDWNDDELISHIREIAAVIPVFGFYLQPAVGGRLLSYNFWRAFADIENVEAIKIASFNRYQTLDVVRAVCESDRWKDISLYTGNDDNIVSDLLTEYEFQTNNELRRKVFSGGLLGHWAVWTKSAVKLFSDIQHCRANNHQGIDRLLTTGVAVTDMNAALFDVANSFRGSIAGIHEILRRQGLLEGIWCLSPREVPSPGQLEELDRVIRMYPELAGLKTAETV